MKMSCFDFVEKLTICITLVGLERVLDLENQ